MKKGFITMVKEVIVVFKTHLDIGFTDYAAEVVNRYKTEFIPAACATARAQEGTNEPFVWTTGSWLLYEALKTDDGTLDGCIRDGLITWHALPFTTHTEYMNEELFRYGLSLSAELDRRYGKKTIAAKMSDVPGHTIAMVPLLAEAGIEFLHIGVNPATPVPNVPSVFRWCYEDKSVIVAYNGGGYGSDFVLGDTALVFGMTGDNHGPQGGEALKEFYAEVAARYPGAHIKAGTLDDFCRRIRHLDFPEIRSEIGDSWIHGVGTDPTKTRAFRAFLRHAGNLSEMHLEDNLLVVPEHTWGMNLNRHFHHDRYWFPEELEAAEGREKFESSWLEQREYVNQALRVNGIDISEDMKVELPCTDGLATTDARPSATLSYQLFDTKDYERHHKDYLQTEVDWAHWDFLKVGLPDSYRGGIYDATVTGAWQDGEKKIFRLEFPEEIRRFCRLPTAYLIEDGESAEVRWFGKGKNRLPEAFWLKFRGLEEKGISLKKLGRYVDPKGALCHPHLHAAFAVRGESWEIENLDSPLVAPFGRHLLDIKAQKDNYDLHFNLYNNVWNTNFPMWFWDDARFRFVIHRKKH